MADLASGIGIVMNGISGLINTLFNHLFEIALLIGIFFLWKHWRKIKAWIERTVDSFKLKKVNKQQI